MMKTPTVLGILALLLTVGSSAWAQLDPDPDGLGVYFDQAANLVTTTAESGQNVTAYLIGTHLSLPGDLGYWQARLCPWGPAEIHGNPVNSYNYNMNMPGDPCWSCYAMAMDPAVPAQDITILAELQIMLWEGGDPVLIFIQDEAAYGIFGSGEETGFRPSSGSWDLPVATINGPAPVAAVSRTWDSLKTLYR
jgi:hypothetical protein